MKKTFLNSINSNRQNNFKAFLRFLKEMKLYHEFFKIMKSCPNGDYKKKYKGNLLYFFNNCPIEDWTTSCFVWVTYNKKGVDWGEVHITWKNKAFTKSY